MRNSLMWLMAFLGLMVSAVATATETPPSKPAVHIQVEGAYINIPLPGKKSTAAYFTVHNRSAKEIILVAVRSDISPRIELHSHTHENGMMKMRRESQVVIPAKSSLSFKPHSWHVMLFDLQGELKTGEELHLTLVFGDGSSLPVLAKVRSLFDEPHH